MNIKYLKLILGAVILFSVIFPMQAQVQPAPGGVNMAANGYTLDLWVDGDHSTNTAWANIVPAAYTLVKNSTNAPTIRNSRFNFHQELYFGNIASSKLFTSTNYNLVRGDSYYVFIVSDASSAGTSDAALLTFNSSATNTSLRWNNSSSTNIMSSYWTTTHRQPNFAAASYSRYGITTMNIVNSHSSPFQLYLNGTQYSTTLSTGNNTSGSAQYNVPMLLGNASNSTSAGSTAPFNGAVQEVILIRKSSASALMPDADLAKIHSYLAIKYGIMLNVGNYVNSDGVAVWDRSKTGYATYNNAVFGIGRDDASGLNQVQSRSAESEMLTIYKGTFGTLNNNRSSELTDKTFLMLGSNGLTGNTDYIYPAGTGFANGSISDKINYRSNDIYRSQITTSGVAGGSQNVDVKVISESARYVIVSDNPSFPIGTTRIYPVLGGIAAGVLINDGDYVTLAGYQSLPGGATSTTFTAWLTPDSYSNGTWTNLINGGSSVGNFTGAQIAPSKINTGGYNFHPVVYFNKSSNSAAPNQLYSQKVHNITSTDNITSIFVMQRKTADAYDFIIGYSGSDNYSSMSWRSSSSSSNNNLTVATADLRTDIGAIRDGILAVDNSNTTATLANEGLRIYKNGTKTAFASRIWNGTTNIGNGTVTLAGGRNSQAWYGYQGNLQEVILIKKSGNGHVDDTDLRKIHSYLAIKYGITLGNTDNYISSNNVTVWDRAANTNYNNNIFGIARDDKSGLYQKQSRSVNTELITAYLGGTLAALNSQNTGTIANDETYLMFGSESGSPIKQLTGISRDEAYESGNLNMSDDPNIQSPVYKTQMTGETSMTVNMKISMSDFGYVLVSNDPTFPTGATGTRFYPIVDYVAQNVEIDQDYKYVKLIGFAPGPGGVTVGLSLWLKADEPASLTLEDRPASDAQTSGNNLYGYGLPANYTGSISAVSEWSDLVRGQTYSYAAGGTATAHRIPVLKHNSPEMNYYPAVQFWASENSYGSYLSNTATNIMPWARPADGKHTAYFLVNNDFGTNAWIYMLTFGSATTGTIPRPGYGVEKLTSGANNGNITGRFRTSGDETSASLNLFSPGATSIMGYNTRTNTSGTSNYAYFRFNGRDDVSSTAASSGDREFNWNNVNFQTPSMLGPGWSYNRTIQGVMSEVILYDRELEAEDRRKLETYMAFKYGVTLTPSNTTTNRFNYTLTNGTIAWEGDTPSGKFADYYNNISAVVRDDAARLHNRHSHSTNVGSILHMGVAGTKLSDDGSEVGRLENDMEAIVSGNDGALGNTHIEDEDACGDFTDRFNRKWLIHKQTKDDRPITMLIGAQDNARLTIGNDANVANDYYNKLGAGYDVCLVVGTSPEDIENGVYKAVIPMSYINGEHQCSYTFTEEDTYVTFGWKKNGKGCVGDEDAVFTGTKKFDWTQWTSRTNTASTSATGLTLPTVPHAEVDLGDDIKVLSTKVAYPSNVRAVRGYPRSVGTPAKGSLEVRRRGGTVNQDVVITVEFNHPVIPEFTISDLDSYSTSYEEVEIYGECSGDTYLPTLSYVSSPNTARYKISGSTATVTKRGGVAGSNKNGMLNVAFQGGVTSITIKYRTKTRATSATQNIYISPITLRAVPPPPPINEDGLSFVKQVKERQISTCDPVEYSFFIQNTNCDPKTVNFSDILPDNMTWEVGSIGLDAVSSEYNPSFDPQIVTSGSGEELKIDGLVIPGTATLVLTATAVLEQDAPGGQYDNRASIAYERIVNNNPVQIPPFYSVDRETLEPFTSFEAIYEQRQDEVVMEPVYSRRTYNANGEVVVTYTVNNANADITDMVLDVLFNEEFTLVGNVVVNQVSGDAVTPIPVKVTADPDSPNMFTIAGDTDGYDGFVLPTGVMEIKFTLKAPLLSGIVDEVDDAGQPTGKKVDLEIAYDFTSGMDDACIQTAIRGLQGVKLIPYSEITHIITNKNQSTRIVK